MAFAAASAQETPSFRAGVSLVKVDVQVTDGGRLIADLSRDDFVVLDGGQKQEIVYFGREAEPLWILLLLDVSGSTRKHVEEMAEASREALDALTTDDHVGIMVFGRETELRRGFTSDIGAIPSAIAGAVRARNLGAATRINAAIIDAAGRLDEEAGAQHGRRAILILTDNKGLNYRNPNEDVTRALYRADAVLNAIVVGNAKPPKPPPPGANPDYTFSNVFLLARETGGEVVKAKNAGRAFRELMERMRTRYSLHYHAPDGSPGSFRPIRVELTAEARRRHPGAEIRARSGYYLR